MLSYMNISNFSNSKVTTCDINQAEAYAATVALHYLFPMHRDKSIDLKTDNQVLVKGVKEAIKKEHTNSTHYSHYANLVHVAKLFQGGVSIGWIPREQNKKADALARKGSGVKRSRSKPSKSKSTTSQASKENPAVIQYDAAADVEDEIAYPFNTPLIAHLLDKSQKQALEDCITFA
ncbi:unnamed protein product, partial [Mesorhabditis belari]|uniref:RNase H type-1 domain-containing protein n=1 Tax=Mesorhabditis belari TaxID=2138241 RepID=A0AAF3ER00_9BILA